LVDQSQQVGQSKIASWLMKSYRLINEKLQVGQSKLIFLVNQDKQVGQ